MSDELKAGETNLIAVKEMHKKVVLEMPYPTVRVILDPKTALSVGNAIAECAYTAEYGLHPNNALTNAVVEEKHKKLVQRVSLMLGSMKGKGAKYKAQQICDVVFAELL